VFDDKNKFKCNYCETAISYRLYGNNEITCTCCGAKYIKEKQLVIKEAP